MVALKRKANKNESTTAESTTVLVPKGRKRRRNRVNKELKEAAVSTANPFRRTNIAKVVNEVLQDTHKGFRIMGEARKALNEGAADFLSFYMLHMQQTATLCGRKTIMLKDHQFFLEAQNLFQK